MMQRHSWARPIFLTYGTILFQINKDKENNIIYYCLIIRNITNIRKIQPHKMDDFA